MAVEGNILIGAPASIATPPAGQVTRFFNTDFSPPKLYYKDENGDVFPYPLASTSEATGCACEIAEDISKSVSCALKSGVINMSSFQTWVNTGMIVAANNTDDGQGNTTRTITIGAANIPATALAMVSAPFNLAVAAQAPVLVSKTPTNATSVIVWSSSNIARATVDQNGIVTGVGAGAVTITASIPSLGLSASVLVTVV